MSTKKEPDESAQIDFEAGCDDERKTFVLHIKSTESLQDDEYAACLRSFAHDLESGNFSFDDALNEHDAKNLN